MGFYLFEYILKIASDGSEFGEFNAHGTLKLSFFTELICILEENISITCYAARIHQLLRTKLCFMHENKAKCHIILPE